MNRVLNFRDIFVVVDEGNLEIANEKFRLNIGNSFLDVKARECSIAPSGDRRVMLDIDISYGMIEFLADDISKSDLYYLNSDMQTIDKDDIANKLLSSDRFQEILYNNIIKK